MAEITRKGFLGAVAAAVVAPAMPTRKPQEEDILIRVGRLTAAVTPADRRQVPETMAVVGLHVEYNAKPFPVPDWLAEHPVWQGLEETDRERADGTHCSAHEAGSWPWNCDVCGTHHGPGEPVHYAHHGEDTTRSCPDCCPACRKRAGLPPKEVPPPQPEPTEQELIDRSIRHDVREGRAAFASNLQTARAMWRKYPELVTAPEFPEAHAAAYREVYGRDLSDADLGADEDVLDPGFMAHVLEEAKEYAQSRLAKIAGVAA